MNTVHEKPADAGDQPTLFDRVLRDEAPPKVTVNPTAQQPTLSIEEQFTVFVENNPHVVDEIIERARALQRRGFNKWSINGVFEAMRYDAAVRTADPSSTWKLNNNIRSRMARLVMQVAPDLAGFFEVRELRS